MPRTSLVLILVLGVSASFAQPTRNEVIPAGTLLQCTLTEPNFSSKTALVGDPILCHLGPVAEFGHSVFPRGAELSGRLQEYKNPGHFVGKGWINLEFDRLVLPGGEILPLSSKVISAPHLRVDAEGKIHGRGHPKRDAIEWVVPILWPVKVLTLPARGPYPALKGETRISLRLMEDIAVQLPHTTKATVAAPPWAGKYENSSPDLFRPALDSYDTHRLVLRSPHYTGSPREADDERPRATVIVLRGGTAYVAQDYWVEAGQMHCVSENGEEKLLPLARIDLDQTVRLNHERNVEFILRGAVKE